MSDKIKNDFLNSFLMMNPYRLGREQLLNVIKTSGLPFEDRVRHCRTVDPSLELGQVNELMHCWWE